jgi:hypothetical protein
LKRIAGASPNWDAECTIMSAIVFDAVAVASISTPSSRIKQQLAT